MSRTSVGRRRAPVAAYLRMVGLGLVASVAMAWVAALFRDSAQLLMFGVMMVMTLPISLMMGWVLFVSDQVVEVDRHAEDNVETRLLEQAGHRTFLDTVGTLGLAAAGFAIVGDRLPIPVSSVLAIVIALIMADFAIRFTVLRRRLNAET